MDWLKLIDKLLERGDFIMPIALTTGVILFAPWIFPQLNSWEAIHSSHPHGWWLFIAFVFTVSFLICRLIKIIGLKILSHVKIQPQFVKKNEELLLCLESTKTQLREIISNKTITNIFQKIGATENEINKVLGKYKT